MTATNQVMPASADDALGQLWRRVQILEAVRSGGGDYVFLEEQEVPTDDDDFITFSDISQEYRHLVFECSVAATNGSDPTTDVYGLSIGPGTAFHSSFNAVQWAWAGQLGDAAPGSAISDADGGSTPRAIMADRDWSAGETGGVVFAQVTIKFGYYTADDRPKSCVFQSEGYVPGAEGNPVLSVLAGGIAFVHTGTHPFAPITRLTFGPDGTSYLAAGSRFSMYGIR